MDRETAELHLRQAEKHVLVSERRVIRQREIVAELACAGHDINAAEQMLTTFEELQVKFISDRQRLQQFVTRGRFSSKRRRRVSPPHQTTIIATEEPLARSASDLAKSMRTLEASARRVGNLRVFHDVD